MHIQPIVSRFTPAGQVCQQNNQSEVWFIFQKDKILIQKNGDLPLQLNAALRSQLSIEEVSIHYLGEFDGAGCLCATIDDTAEPPDGYEFVGLRSLGGQVEQEIFMLAGRASHILHWDKLSRFCGRCGAPTRMKTDERAKRCDSCGNIIYPRISPAIIIAIIRDDEILLANNRNFRQNMYSLVAGFMEPGEEFEDTAKREVFEEVGVQIKNIRYVASQPWPFPDSLMIGLVADYAGGEITVDKIEIDRADWFRRGQLPEVPATLSIAGRIIRRFEENTL